MNFLTHSICSRLLPQGIFCWSSWNHFSQTCWNASSKECQLAKDYVASLFAHLISSCFLACQMEMKECILSHFANSSLSIWLSTIAMIFSTDFWFIFIAVIRKLRAIYDKRRTVNRSSSHLRLFWLKKKPAISNQFSLWDGEDGSKIPCLPSKRHHACYIVRCALKIKTFIDSAKAPVALPWVPEPKIQLRK